MGDALTHQVEALKQEKSLRQIVFLPFSVLRKSFTLALAHLIIIILLEHASNFNCIT
jgi:hypothetical protein